MPRRTYIRSRRPRKKYSIQQKAFSFTAAPSATTSVEIVPATTVEGMRKVKHVTVNCSAMSVEFPIYWALVYVPQGTTPGALNIATTADETSLYEPNQFVMNCGIADPDAGPIRVWSPLARNLNDGDRILLLCTHINSASLTIYALSRYAITY
uniref:Capsid protein n=1 Tax=unidentified TaxID=32644 RepID=A0A6G9W288_9ZZZZ|nr:capsid protein [unidentified]